MHSKMSMWMCPPLPVDVDEGQTAAATAGKRIRRNLFPCQHLKHSGLPSKEIFNKTHELQQSNGVISLGQK